LSGTPVRDSLLRFPRSRDAPELPSRSATTPLSLQRKLMNVLNIERLPQLIENTLTELGMPGANWSCVKSLGSGRHPVLVPQDGVLVVWLTDREVAEFYGEGGVLLRSVDLRQGADRGKAA
jgi:hypothetical protein